MIKYILTFMLISFSSVLLLAQRTVTWVHSAGDNNTFWQNMVNDPDFAGRNHVNQTYSNNLTTAIGQLAMLPPNPRTIAIGHGVGGLAIREVNQQFDQIYGGIITFGAPLNGMALINSTLNGNSDLFIATAQEKLHKGPNANKNYDPTFNIMYIIEIVNPTVGKLLGNMFDEIGTVNMITEQLENLQPNVALEPLSVGSEYINNARSYQTADPKILVYGEEDPRVHVRLASSRASDGLNDNEILDDYEEMIDYYRLQANIWEPLPGCLFYCNALMNVAQAYKEGELYLEDEMEWRWHQLIKATGTTTGGTYTYLKNVCDPNAPSPDPGGRVSKFAPPLTDDCYQWVTVTYTIGTKLPNDGLVEFRSASGNNSQWTNQNTDVVQALGVNHFEMGEHPETENILGEALNGTSIRFDGFFRGNN